MTSSPSLRGGLLLTTTDDRRRQTPASKTILAAYTMCRRASNDPAPIFASSVVSPFHLFPPTTLRVYGSIVSYTIAGSHAVGKVFGTY